MLFLHSPNFIYFYTMASQQHKGKQVALDFGPLAATTLSTQLDAYVGQKILILVDENTQQHCLDYLLTSFEQLAQAEILVIPAGEESKSIELAVQLWDLLLAYEVTKKDLLICLGGGVVTDMGGFIASTYKRGLDVIMIPTTLLCMVDAAIGGKNGIDFKGFKNMIGCNKQPLHIFIDPAFLHTLPTEELRSGWAECIKHALINGPELWQQVQKITPFIDWENFQLDSAIFWELILTKIQIVEQDPLETNLRKVLNLGHTIGHALEAHQLQIDAPIAHGHAVAWGILIEAMIATNQGVMLEKDLNSIHELIAAIYTPLRWDQLNVAALAVYLDQDKKNQDQLWRYVALQKAGVYEMNSVIHSQELDAALKALQSMK